MLREVHSGRGQRGKKPLGGFGWSKIRDDGGTNWDRHDGSERLWALATLSQFAASLYAQFECNGGSEQATKKGRRSSRCKKLRLVSDSGLAPFSHPLSSR